jgi:hypothetical protein
MPRLARPASVSGLVLAAALLCAAAAAGPAAAASSALDPTPTSASAPTGRSGPGLPTPRVFDAAGFDTCSAPPLSTMQTWYRTSPYRAVGIYIGGRDRACAGGNLSPYWVSAVSAQGWGLIPIYVGLQAPCASSKGLTGRMVPGQAAQEGAGEADDAANQAAAYGLAQGSPVYFDLEAFTETDQGCVNTVLTFLDAWTRELHAQGYYSGVYGSAASGMATLADAVQTRSAFAPPDAIWIARWDQQARTADGSVPNQMWDRQQRIKQYQGGHVEKHGGVALDVDSDYLNGPVARLR